jgi:predicted small lipoprotein YifL
MNSRSMFPVAFIAVFVFLSGCGQTGDLYLPEDSAGEAVVTSSDAQPPETEEYSREDESQE